MSLVLLLESVRGGQQSDLSSMLEEIVEIKVEWKIWELK